MAEASWTRRLESTLRSRTYRVHIDTSPGQPASWVSLKVMLDGDVSLRPDKSLSKSDFRTDKEGNAMVIVYRVAGISGDLEFALQASGGDATALLTLGALAESLLPRPESV